MGLMDVLGGRFGWRTPKSGDPLMDALLPMLTKGVGKGGFGGLGGLIGQFTGAGMGRKANSWVGTGENQSLEPDEVEAALGREQVEQIATEAGMTRAEAKSGLADMIPAFVDEMSPGGSLPTGSLAKSLRGFDFDSLLGG